MSDLDWRGHFVALEQLVALTAKYPNCMETPDGLREAFESEEYAADEPWRGGLLLELCETGFTPELCSCNGSLAERCSGVCESLVQTQDCTREQAFWAVMVWSMVAEASSKAVPAEPMAAEDLWAATQHALRESWAHCQVGDVFTFGNYPQSANGEKKPIEWQVLRRDSDGLLVVSKYALDCKKYNDECCEITWSECTLRKWLNDEFFTEAFNEIERQQIIQVHLENPNSKFDSTISGGADTDDKVFLLSHDEAMSLFGADENRYCKATDYAVENGAWTDDDNGMCYWWLRSPGLNHYDAADVYNDGDIFYYYINFVNDAVRPALKLAI